MFPRIVIRSSRPQATLRYASSVLTTLTIGNAWPKLFGLLFRTARDEVYAEGVLWILPQAFDVSQTASGTSHIQDGNTTRPLRCRLDPEHSLVRVACSKFCPHR